MSVQVAALARLPGVFPVAGILNVPYTPATIPLLPNVLLPPSQVQLLGAIVCALGAGHRKPDASKRESAARGWVLRVLPKALLTEPNNPDATKPRVPAQDDGWR